MSHPKSITLLQLVRLLHNDVSQEEGIRLRELLASSRPIAAAMQKVMAAAQLSETEHVAGEDGICPADALCAYLDGQLPQDEAQQLEQQCLSSPSQMRDLIESWKSVSLPTDVEEPSLSLDAMAKIAVRECVPTDEATQSSSALPERQPPSWDDVFRDETAPAGTTRGSRAVNGNRIQRRPDLSRNDAADSPARGRVWSGTKLTSLLTAGVVVAGLWFVAVSLLNSDRNRVDEIADGGEIPGDRRRRDGPQLTEQNERPRLPQDSLDPPGSEFEPLRTIEEQPQSSDDGQMIADGSGDSSITAPGNTPSTTGNGSGGDSPSRDLAARQPIVTDISSVEGVVGVRNPDSQLWLGVASRPSRSVWQGTDPVRLLSMMDSRAIVKTTDLGDIVLDATTDLEVSASDTAEASAGVSLNLRQGRCGFSLMEAERVLVLRLNQQKATLQTTETSGWSLRRDGNRLILSVVRGTVVLAGLTVSRRQSATVSASGSVTVDTERTPPDDWYRDRNFRSSLPDDVCLALNSSDTLRRDAARFATDSNPATAFLATQVLLQCSSRAETAFPGDIVARLAGSQLETQRHSVVHWLVSRIGQQPSAGDRIVLAVCDQLQIAKPQTTLMQQWYKSAVVGSRPSLSELRALVAGLQNRDHIFVRQSAKYFLQSIMGDPLSEFDPSRPNDRNALQSVMRKLRSWQRVHLP